MLKSLEVVDGIGRDGSEVETTIYDEEGDEFDENEFDDEEGNIILI